MARIYLSSTYSDLEPYREAVYRTLRQLGHDVLAMEDYVAQDQRPVNKCLADVAACEVYVGIFAWRYGFIPPQENPAKRSITELEYRHAGTTGKERMLFLVDEDIPWPRKLTDDVTGEGDRGACIATLRQALTEAHTVSFFTTPDDLAKLVSVAVGQWSGEQAPASPTNESARRRYLTRLYNYCQSLPLAALGGDPGSDQDLTLDQVYIVLNTTTITRASEAERNRHRTEVKQLLDKARRLRVIDETLSPDQREGLAWLHQWIATGELANKKPTELPPQDREWYDALDRALQHVSEDQLSEADRERLSHQERELYARLTWLLERPTGPISAVEAAQYFSRLVLLGDPGAGKSTFVRYLVAGLAAVHLNQVPSLTVGVPTDLLPILITLRELAPQLAPLALANLSVDDRKQNLAAAVRDHVVADLARWEAQDFAQELEAMLTDGRCLLVLDGLDEVPYDLRTVVREAVGAVIGAYTMQRVMVTCRARSYVGEATFPHFQDYTLAPFDDKSIRAFTHAWYIAQRDLGRIDTLQAERRAADLATAALTDGLRELATNPMLLTTMAIIHQREIGLPKERVRLYNLAVEVLLRRWEQARTGEAALTGHPALTKLLTDDRRLRPVMEMLAYEAHRNQQKGRATADLPRGGALTLLEKSAYLGDVGLAGAFLDYVDQRAGLLVGRGGPQEEITYSFPHRTFQEYLAARHVVSRRGTDAVRLIFAHAAEGDLWDFVVRLGAEELLYNRPSPHELLDLAYSLCPADAESPSSKAQRAILWSAAMAVLAGRHTIEQDTGNPSGGRSYLARVLRHTIAILAQNPSTAEKPQAGVDMATLDDLRFREDAWYLPNEPLLGFVEIPAGRFLMGSDPVRDRRALESEQPQHEVYLSTYYIARYPVTVAQFRAFVELSGYEPSDRRCLSGVSNHPVVNVSWHDAVTYCTWLTEQLRAWADAPASSKACFSAGARVRLPTEAEWEKAARGSDGRLYPWGYNAPDPHLANYLETGINTPSAVGCFPDGSSPYGVEEMSGNVWEWVHDRYARDYYTQSPSKDPQGPDTGENRVMRGGSFYASPEFLRSAARVVDAPEVRLRAHGFRCVRVSPQP